MKESFSCLDTFSTETSDSVYRVIYPNGKRSGRLRKINAELLASFVNGEVVYEGVERVNFLGCYPIE